MKGMKYVAVLFACLPLSLPPNAQGDICYSSFVKNLQQEGQDVVMTVGGQETILRTSDREMVEIDVPGYLLADSCPNPSSNWYCMNIPCGQFRDTCVPPGDYAYTCREISWFSCYGNPSIEVTDTGHPCLERCDDLYWGNGEVAGSNIGVLLMTHVAGTLYRHSDYGGMPEYNDSVGTELAVIHPDELTGYCRAPSDHADCCLPCGRIIDRCPENENHRYRFVPFDDTVPTKWSARFEIEPSDSCVREWRIEPVVSTCDYSPPDEDEPEPDMETGEPEGDSTAEPVIGARGSGAACSFISPAASQSAVAVILLLIGLFALRKSRDRLHG